MSKVIAFVESVATWVKGSPYYVSITFILGMVLGAVL